MICPAMSNNVPGSKSCLPFPFKSGRSDVTWYHPERCVAPGERRRQRINAAVILNHLHPVVNGRKLFCHWLVMQMPRADTVGVNTGTRAAHSLHCLCQVVLRPWTSERD